MAAAPRTRRTHRTKRAAAPGRTRAGRPSSTDGSLGFYGYRVGEVMTRPAQTVREEDSLRAAATLMSRRSVSGLPVLDARGHLTGVVSQKDILRVLHDRAGLALPGGLFDLLLGPEEAHRADRASAYRAVLDGTPVRAAMSRPAITVDSGRTIDEAIRVMLEHQVNRLPVLRGGRLAGIVTRHDLLTGIGRSTETR